MQQICRKVLNSDKYRIQLLLYLSSHLQTSGPSACRWRRRSVVMIVV